MLSSRTSWYTHVFYKRIKNEYQIMCQTKLCVDWLKLYYAMAMKMNKKNSANDMTMVALEEWEDTKRVHTWQNEKNSNTPHTLTIVNCSYDFIEEKMEGAKRQQRCYFGERKQHHVACNMQTVIFIDRLKCIEILKFFSTYCFLHPFYSIHSFYTEVMSGMKPPIESIISIFH